ncbi:MAG: family 43 glycosylhydrolase [Clostridia bacterium]|nr:family 43 glycosylhydrolase [Clostridia bacterium]
MKQYEAMIEAGEAEALSRCLITGMLSQKSEMEKAGLLWHAVRLGKTGMVRVLTERCHGLRLDADEKGNTLLHAAVQSGNTETAEFVAEVLGFSPFTGNSDGISPLQLSATVSDAMQTCMERLAGMSLADTYRNPVLRGWHPDPSVLRVGDDYYLINSSFVMMPALPISHSKDLVHWETIGHVFEDPVTAQIEGLPGGFGYWAPDLSCYDGRFYVVATLRRNKYPFRLQMLTWASAPEGPWAKPVFLSVDGIDPSLFTDDDGRRYLVLNPGVQIAEITKDGQLLEEPRMIYYGSRRYKSEGPHLFKRDGYYYILEAEGGTGQGHMVTVARSENLRGPYTPCPMNPVLGTTQQDAYIRRSGHGKLVGLPDGRCAMMYLCGRSVEGKTLMGRETGLDPVTFIDGWPVVNNLQGPSCIQKKLLPDWACEERPAWYCPRQNVHDFADFSDGILLQCGKDPSETADSHLLLHRQQETGISQQVTVKPSMGAYAGLCAYYDENSFILYGIKKDASGASLILTVQEGLNRTETVIADGIGDEVTLSAEGKGLKRSFICNGKTVTADITCLTDEGLHLGKRFTGAMLGLFAAGNGSACMRDYREEQWNE